MRSSFLQSVLFPDTLALRLLYTLASVLLVFLSAPQQPWPLLAVIWMVPLGLALYATSEKMSALLCGLCAALFWTVSIYWLVPAIIQFTGVSTWLAWAMYGLLCLILAIPYAIFGYLYALFRCYKHALGPWLVAALMTCSMMFLPSVLPGSPLHALYAYPRLLQTLDISGLSSLLFSATLFQFLLVQCLQSQGGRRRLGCVQLVLLAAFVAAYGSYRHDAYQQEKKTAGENQWINLGLIQPNLRREDSSDTLLQLSTRLSGLNEKPDPIVWPEFPPAFSLIDNPADRRRTLAFSKDFQQDLMVVSGYVFTTARTVEHPQPDYYNANHLVKNGEIVASYYKRTLVPFFEYLPGKAIWPQLLQWFPDSLQYTPGTSARPIDFNDDVHIIPAICYEAIFPKAVAEMVDNGGNILINPVSDTWFGDSPGSAQHLSVGLFRSIEHNMPWLRVANSGISVAVEASGDIIVNSKTELNTQVVASHALFIPKYRTLYSRWGDWLSPVLFVLLVLFAIYSKLFTRSGERVIQNRDV